MKRHIKELRLVIMSGYENRGGIEWSVGQNSFSKENESFHCGAPEAVGIISSFVARATNGLSHNLFITCAPTFFFFFFFSPPSPYLPWESWERRKGEGGNGVKQSGR